MGLPSETAVWAALLDKHQGFFLTPLEINSDQVSLSISCALLVDLTCGDCAKHGNNNLYCQNSKIGYLFLTQES